MAKVAPGVAFVDGSVGAEGGACLAATCLVGCCCVSRKKVWRVATRPSGRQEAAKEAGDCWATFQRGNPRLVWWLKRAHRTVLAALFATDVFTDVELYLAVSAVGTLSFYRGSFRGLMVVLYSQSFFFNLTDCGVVVVARASSS